MSHEYTYPAAEHYVFPSNHIEQAYDEIRLYPTSVEFNSNLTALMRLYEQTPCMKAMKKYAELASVLRIPDIEGARAKNFNPGFYNGALLAVHINIKPAPEYLQYAILSTDFLSNLDENPYQDEIEETVKAWFRKWEGETEEGDVSWSDFFVQQDEAYQDSVLKMAELIYDTESYAPEQQLDFLLGYTFASNLVWMTAGARKIQAPV